MSKYGFSSEWDKQDYYKSFNEGKENPPTPLSADQKEVLELLADEKEKMTKSEWATMFVDILKTTSPHNPFLCKPETYPEAFKKEIERTARQIREINEAKNQMINDLKKEGAE